MDAAIPAGADNLSQPFGVVAISLVELHGQSSLGVTSIETDYIQATTPQLVHEPRHQRTSLNTDLEIVTMPTQDLGQSFGVGRGRATLQAAALLIHDADRGLLLRNIQAGIVGHRLLLLCWANQTVV